MTSYCSFCGTKLRDDGNFCEECGRKIISEEEKKKQIAPEVEKEINKKIEKNVGKEHLKKDLINYMLLISTVICIFSIIIPWGTLQEKSTLYYNGIEINFYIWGIQSSNSSLKTEWSFFINPSSLLNIFTNDEINVIAFPLALWFATFCIALMIIILGFSAVISIKNIQKYNFLTLAGGLAILSLIFFFIFINFGLFSSKLGLTLKSDFNWSFGFFLMLLSGILFFVTFFIHRYVPTSDNIQGSDGEKK